MELTSFGVSHNLTPSDDEYIPPELIELTHQVVTPQQFEELCSEYTELRLELTSTGELIIMPPTGSETGVRNADLTYQLMAWTRKDGSGVCFDSSAGFALPDGSRRSPDGSWVKRERWDSLTEQEKESFAPICPDFIVELRSPADRLRTLRNKMLEYMENGASLGWLIDPFERRVHVYRRDQEPSVLSDPRTVSGDPLLRGFTLNLAELW